MPFALLAAVQLVAVAAWVALACGALVAGRRQPAAPLAAGGALLLAGVEAYTGSDLGVAASPGAAWLRALGAALLVAGLLGGAPGVRRATASADAPALAVAPLAAAGLPAPVLASLLLSAAGALVLRRPALGRLPLAAGLVLAGLAAGLAAHAEHSAAAAVAVLVVRGLGALALLGWAARLAGGSLLAKVVASILGSLVAASLVIAAVVGSVVTDRLGRQQAEQVAGVARTEQTALATQALQGEVFAQTLLGNPANAAVLAGIQDTFTKVGAIVAADGSVTVLDLATPADVVASMRADLARQPAVQRLLREPGSGTSSTVAVLRGSRPVTALLSLAAPRQVPPGPPAAVGVYGVVLDAALLRRNDGGSGFTATVVALDGAPAGASDPATAAAVAADARVRAALADPPDEDTPRTMVSRGSEQTLGIATLTQGTAPVALLVVSAPARDVLQTQRDVLRVLFVALVGTALLVALLALALGRRVVEPVRRLTGAAERVRGGDLHATAGVTGRDEVARLSLSFDAMTGSLVRAADDLRATAETEAATRTRLETVLASITDGLVVADAVGLVESVNPAAAAILGPAEGTLGRPLAEVLPGLDVDRQAPVEALLERPGGGVVPVVMACAPLSDVGGTVVVLRDTSREREVERMKTEFLSNVSHELRTPLTPIRGYADILVRRGATLPAEKAVLYAGVVLESSKRLTRVVDLLVDVAALDAGRVRPQPGPVALGDFVDGRLAAWREKDPARAGDLHRRVAARLPPAMVDEGWLRKAVDELIDNALRHTTPGVAVTLLVSQGSGSHLLRIAVRDAGPGIQADRRALLLTDFEQVDGSATRSRDGLGLGLPFVRRVADVVGLRLTVETEVGRGSTFSLEVPAVSPAPAPAALPPAPRPPPAGSRPGRRRVPPPGRGR